jgi:hypothetical protein
MALFLLVPAAASTRSYAALRGSGSGYAPDSLLDRGHLVALFFVGQRVAEPEQQ